MGWDQSGTMIAVGGGKFERAEVELVEADFQAAGPCFADGNVKPADALADEYDLAKVPHAALLADTSYGVVQRVDRKPDTTIPPS